MPALSPYQLLKRDWINCKRCPLHEARKQVVLCKGSIPADVLFIGEAPGESEDVLGKPFCGPAGRLIEEQVASALRDSGNTQLRLAWTNLVACIPKNPDTRRKNVEPLPHEIAECYPRLDRFIDICKPSLIVCVGTLAEKQAKAQDWASRIDEVISIVHPAAILRMDVSQKGLAFERGVVKLAAAFENISSF